MKRKILFLMVVIALFALLTLSVSAMEINDDYIAENGDYEMHWVYGDTVYVNNDSGPKNIAKYEASYLSIDGTVKDGVFYANTSMYNGSQVFNKLYVPGDYDLTQLTVLPDVYVTDDGTRRNIEMFCGESGGTGFYTYDEYTGELSFTNAVERNDAVEALTYSKYTVFFGLDTLAGRNNLKTVTYNGKTAVDGTFFVSPTVQEFAQGAFGAGNNNDANNIQVLWFEDRGSDDLIIGKWCFARGAVEKIIFGSGYYKISTWDTIGYFYNDTGFTLREIVFCSGANIDKTIGKEVGSYDTIYVGTEEECQTDKHNFGGHKVTVYNPCYLTGHNLISSDIQYAGGYLSEGEKTVSCTNEGCAYSGTVSAPALFNCLGYSAPENGKGGISVGFTVNNEAIAEYEETTKKTVSYGVFAALKDRLNDGDIFVDGEANECAIVVDMTIYATAAFEIKIIGFETDNQKTAQIAMGAYVAVSDGETTEYSYMQNGAPDENEKYCFDSFNDVLAQLSSKA